MKRLSFRHQRTVAKPAEVGGVGFLTGANVRLRFLPAPPNTGTVFVRTDLRGGPRIAGTVWNVTGTQRRTTLGHAPANVTLVEHVLAALAGLRIDNCLIELNGAEPPGLDGSARSFATALVAAGVELQPAKRAIWTVTEPVSVAHGKSTLTLHPHTGDTLRISYLLDYGTNCGIDRQSYTQFVTPERFTSEIAACRTFLMEEEAVEFRRQGLGVQLSPSDLVVFGPRGPIGNRLRFANEPARHKVLDIIGDLSLFGADLRGHLVAYRSGHPLNIELVRELDARLGSSTLPLVVGAPFRAAA